MSMIVFNPQVSSTDSVLPSLPMPCHAPLQPVLISTSLYTTCTWILSWPDTAVGGTGKAPSAAAAAWAVARRSAIACRAACALASSLWTSLCIATLYQCEGQDWQAVISLEHTILYFGNVCVHSGSDTEVSQLLQLHLSSSGAQKSGAERLGVCPRVCASGILCRQSG